MVEFKNLVEILIEELVFTNEDINYGNSKAGIVSNH